MYKNKLEEILQKEFPHRDIIKLKDLTSKIAGISKVRYGNNCTNSNYDEISLNYVDEDGYIYINEKESPPANETALKNQELHQGDLIILHRGKIGKMGIIGEDYKRRVVGNNSMIRIQFNDNRRNNTPFFVMQYLQLSYVKDYINDYIPSSSSIKRKILNPTVLEMLPIPIFKENEFNFKRFIIQKKQLKINIILMKNKLDSLLEKQDLLNERNFNQAINNTEISLDIIDKDAEKLDKIRLLNNQISELLNNY